MYLRSKWFIIRLRSSRPFRVITSVINISRANACSTRKSAFRVIRRWWKSWSRLLAAFAASYRTNFVRVLAFFFAAKIWCFCAIRGFIAALNDKRLFLTVQWKLTVLQRNAAASWPKSAWQTINFILFFFSLRTKISCARFRRTTRILILQKERSRK